jgi:hypothetical protein
MSGYNFGKVNLPGPADTYIYISVNGVDAAGLTVGNYGDSNDEFHGFTADSGTPVILDPPDSSNTDLGGITASGEIFGNYTSFQNQQVGFVYDNGSFITVDAPLAQETTVFGITGGEIFGGYVDVFGGSHGFLDSGGVFTQIDVPGATSTTITGVTPNGEIAGTIFDSSNQAHGFVDVNGAFTTIDPAGSTGTYVVGISATGVIAGTYYDSAQNSHAFLDANGLISTINIAGATATAVTGINASGEVVGYSVDSLGNIHGFVDNLGSAVTVDVPGATQTDILGVNDAGDIYGYYNVGATQFGFVGTSTGGAGSFSATTDTGVAYATTGHVVTVTMTLGEAMTVDGIPTLQLNDNEAAVYAGGSGTDTLTFSYTVQAGDSATDLQVTGLNYPPGASIQDAYGNGIAGLVTADLGIQVNTPSAPIAEQIGEIYGSVLQHAPTDAEVTSELSVASTTGIAAVVSALVNSSETQFNVDPVAQIIDLALGTFPTAHQLAGWVPFIESAGLLQGPAQTNDLLDQMATAFVASDNFGKVYNNGVDVDPNAPVTAQEMQVIIQAATDKAATPTQVAAWVATGLTIDQVFVDFALGDQYTAASQPAIQQYLTTLADNAAGVQTSIVGSIEASHSLVAHA